MFPLPMKDIVHDGILLPGNWDAWTWHIRPADEDEAGRVLNHYVPMLMALGKSQNEAVKVAMQIPQDRIDFGMSHGGKASVMYRYKKYGELLAKEYDPRLIYTRQNGLIEFLGFDPARIWYYYLPTAGAGVVWGKGGPQEALVEMADQAERELHKGRNRETWTYEAREEAKKRRR